jgi:hypothetical protein
MPNLSLKPTHKPVRAYYDALAEYNQKEIVHEGAVQTTFQDLLGSIMRLIKQVITISLEIVQIVNDLPDLGLPSDEQFLKTKKRMQ